MKQCSRKRCGNGKTNAKESDNELKDRKPKLAKDTRENGQNILQKRAMLNVFRLINSMYVE